MSTKGLKNRIIEFTSKNPKKIMILLCSKKPQCHNAKNSMPLFHLRNIPGKLQDKSRVVFEWP